MILCTSGYMGLQNGTQFGAHSSGADALVISGMPVFCSSFCRLE